MVLMADIFKLAENLLGEYKKGHPRLGMWPSSLWICSPHPWGSPLTGPAEAVAYMDVGMSI